MVRKSGEDLWSVRLEGRHEYALANVQNVHAMVRALEKAEESLQDTLKTTQGRIAHMVRTLADLKAEGIRPFAQQDRFLALLKRQSELDTELELKAGDMAAMDDEEQSSEPVAA